MQKRFFISLFSFLKCRLVTYNTGQTTYVVCLMGLLARAQKFAMQSSDTLILFLKSKKSYILDFCKTIAKTKLNKRQKLVFLVMGIRFEISQITFLKLHIPFCKVRVKTFMGNHFLYVHTFVHIFKTAISPTNDAKHLVHI